MTTLRRFPRPGRTLAELGAVNHQSFFAAAAEAAGGTVLRRHDGVVAVVRGDAAQVLFATVPIPDVAEFADEMLALFAQHRPVTEIGWWSLDSAGIPALGAALRGRGFGWGWQPNWMALDVAELVTDLPRPAGLFVTESGAGPWRFTARLDGETVGRGQLHVCDDDGTLIGGIYDMAVEPAHQRRGIGTALTVAASTRAGDLGCRIVLLNATAMGEPVYRRAGFVALGQQGQTWWRSGDH